MKIVIQRSKKASVSINNEIFSEIGQGILVLVGVEEQDEQDDIDYLVKKLQS